MSLADRIARGVVVIGLVLIVMLLMAITSEVRRTRVVLERAWPSNEQIDRVESEYWRGYEEGKKAQP